MQSLSKRVDYIKKVEKMNETNIKKDNNAKSKNKIHFKRQNNVDYNKIKIADTTKKYIEDSKKIYNTKSPGKVKKQDFLEKDGVIYKVKGKDVILNPDESEEECANILAKTFGEDVILLPKVNNP